jgi:hypothetical protein
VRRGRKAHGPPFSREVAGLPNGGVTTEKALKRAPLRQEGHMQKMMGRTVGVQALALMHPLRILATTVGAALLVWGLLLCARSSPLRGLPGAPSRRSGPESRGRRARSLVQAARSPYDGHGSSSLRFRSVDIRHQPSWRTMIPLSSGPPIYRTLRTQSPTCVRCIEHLLCRHYRV